MLLWHVNTSRIFKCHAKKRWPCIRNRVPTANHNVISTSEKGSIIFCKTSFIQKCVQFFRAISWFTHTITRFSGEQLKQFFYWYSRIGSSTESCYFPKNDSIGPAKKRSLTLTCMGHYILILRLHIAIFTIRCV